jgi:hypothetical protein
MLTQSKTSTQKIAIFENLLLSKFLQRHVFIINSNLRRFTHYFHIYDFENYTSDSLI